MGNESPESNPLATYTDSDFTVGDLKNISPQTLLDSLRPAEIFKTANITRAIFRRRSDIFFLWEENLECFVIPRDY